MLLESVIHFDSMVGQERVLPEVGHVDGPAKGVVEAIVNEGEKAMMGVGLSWLIMIGLEGSRM